MKKHHWLVLIFSGIVLLFFVLGFALPKRILVETEIEVNQDAQTSLNFLADLHNWNKWTQINEENDTSIEFTYSGASSGIGSEKSWTSEKLGAGKLKITNITQMPVLHYILEPNESELLFNCKFEIRQKEDAKVSNIRWVVVTDLGMNPIMRYAGLALERNLKTEMQGEIEKLKEVLENE